MLLLICLSTCIAMPILFTADLDMFTVAVGHPRTTGDQLISRLLGTGSWLKVSDGLLGAFFESSFFPAAVQAPGDEWAAEIPLDFGLLTGPRAPHLFHILFRSELTKDDLAAEHHTSYPGAPPLMPTTSSWRFTTKCMTCGPFK